MTREYAEKLVQQAILNHADITPGKYQFTDSLESLDIDSLDLVELGIELETALKLDDELIASSQFDSIKTVNDLIAIVEKQIVTVQ